MFWDVFGAFIVRPTRGSCCGTISRSMLSDVLDAHVVELAGGSCCGKFSAPMLWNVFGAHVGGTCRDPMVQDVFGAHVVVRAPPHVVGHVRRSC